MYAGRNISATTKKEVQNTVDKICAECFKELSKEEEENSDNVSTFCSRTEWIYDSWWIIKAYVIRNIYI
jgi:hypothetical protein